MILRERHTRVGGLSCHKPPGGGAVEPCLDRRLHTSRDGYLGNNPRKNGNGKQNGRVLNDDLQPDTVVVESH